MLYPGAGRGQGALESGALSGRRQLVDVALGMWGEGGWAGPGIVVYARVSFFPPLPSPFAITHGYIRMMFGEKM